MRNFSKRGSSILMVLVLVFSLSAQQPAEILVVANKPVTDVQPTMWGVFFEDINFAADGGLYAELVKNRSFEFSLPMMGWRQIRQNGKGLSFTKEGSIETLQSKRLSDFNTIANPGLIYPSSKALVMTGKKLSLDLDAISVNVLILDYKK